MSDRGSACLLTPGWVVSARVHACTTTRYGAGVSAAPFDAFNLGAHCGDDALAVRENRRLLCERANLPDAPCWLQQVHGTGVAMIDRATAAEPRDALQALSVADAAVTRESGVVLAILTADCLPVLFCAEDGSEIGAAHAGWRGLCAGVLEATVAAMTTPAAQLRVWLGPAAGPQAYEVGNEVREAFVALDTDAAQAFRPTRPGHYFCDLYALARQRLQRLGIGDIHGGEHCTLSEPQRFFSHRRDGRSGRMASLIWRD